MSPSLAKVVAYIFLLTSACQGQGRKQASCNPTECKLPECLCASTRIPNNLAPSEIPMLVAFTSDDAVNEQVYDSLKHLFCPTRRNPNGAPISMTLFVSNDHPNQTNHCQVAEFYLGGHEIASHTISHKKPSSY